MGAAAVAGVAQRSYGFSSFYIVAEIYMDSVEMAVESAEVSAVIDFNGIAEVPAPARFHNDAVRG